MKLFLLTQEIDFPVKEFDNYDRHKYPQQYLRTIIEERIPDSRVIITDSKDIRDRLEEIAKKLNEYVPNADKKLQEYMNNYKYALNVAEELDLMNSFNVLSDDKDKQEQYHKQRQKHMDAMRKISPEYGIRLAGDCFTYNQPRPISSFTEIKIPTDVAGIIVPIGHADHNDLWHIIHGVTGLFSEQLKEIKAKHDINIKPGDNSNNYRVQERNQAVEDFFYTRFKIPVFESYKYAPADRFDNTPVGQNMLWKETEYNFGREDFIKFALNKWIDTYFPKHA